MSYSVAIEVDSTGDVTAPYGAYLLFLRWRRIGQQGIEGHLESAILESGESADEARAALGAWKLNDVKALLDTLIAKSSQGAGGRRWWDVMREDDAKSEGGEAS